MPNLEIKKVEHDCFLSVSATGKYEPLFKLKNEALNYSREKLRKFPPKEVLRLTYGKYSEFPDWYVGTEDNENSGIHRKVDPLMIKMEIDQK